MNGEEAMVPGSGAGRDGHRATQPTLAMTPMIDVVFLLIIFFMCSQFRTLEGELLARLPERSGLVPGARVRPGHRAALARIFVSRTPAGGARYLLDGQVLPSPAGLYPRLLALREVHPDLEAVIDGDDDLPFGHFLFALDQCLRAGITKVNIAAPRVPVPED